MFLAVAVIKSVTEEIEYHGFEYYPLFSSIVAKQNDFPEAAYCDFLWFMVHPKYFNKNLIQKMNTNLPDYAGIVLLKEGQVEVIKKATRGPVIGDMKDKLISALFSRML